MHKIYTDSEKNRLYLQLSGNIDKRESRNALDKVIGQLEQLNPGFDLISDLTSYTPLSQTADTTVYALLKTVKEHGVKRMIRIVNEPGTVSSNQVNYLINSAGFCNCEVVESLNRAEEILEC